MKLLTIFALVVPFIVQAQTETLETIEVSDHSSGQGLMDYVPVSKTLKEKEIRKKLQPTVADTLQGEAGVAATQFGPNSSRPVLRGLDGARIRLLQNGLQLLDVSTQSVDHAVPVEPLIIDQIEIIRGAMGVLYGSSAVGGVVNIVTNRIHSNFEEGNVVELQSQGETNNRGLSNSVRLDHGANQWMFHLDASTRNLQNQRIPGYASSKNARKNNPDGKDEEHELENSQNRQDSIGTGVTKFFNRGMVGLAFNHFKSDYGTVVEKEVTIGMEQNRVELHAEYRPENNLFQKLRIKSAQTDYRHREFEGDVTGTFFKNIGNETRLEALSKLGDVQGTTGIQTDVFHFESRGEEAFLPQVDSEVVALFTYQQLSQGKNIFSLGGRLENTSIHKEPTSTMPGNDQFGFFAYNGSAGYTYELTNERSVSLNYSYTERAPTFQELLADGAHLATGTYEQGNSGLTKEKAHGIEVNYKVQSLKNNLSLSFYTQSFSDYISLNPNGDKTDGYPEFDFEQVDAVLYGMDLDAKRLLSQSEKGSLSLFSKFDWIQGRDQDSHQNLPRLSPPRLAAGFEHLKGNWESDIEAQHVFDQNLNAPNETRTGSYTLTNIGTQYSLKMKASQLDVFFRVRNIFDVEARSHVSFLKEVAPLPGRNIILGVHWLL
jgi:iron complex outermembrane recepter protein